MGADEVLALERPPYNFLYEVEVAFRFAQSTSIVGLLVLWRALAGIGIGNGWLGLVVVVADLILELALLDVRLVAVVSR